MTVPLYGALLLIFGLALWLYLAGSRRLDDAEAELRAYEMLRRVYEADRVVPQWARTELYDWAERGEL